MNLDTFGKHGSSLKIASRKAVLRFNRNRGFALVVVLLIMVALSMVGIASMRSVTLQEKMAGNLYFRSLAMSEAESALRSTAAKMESLVGLSIATPDTADDSSPDWKARLQQGSNVSYWTGSSAWSNTSTRSAMSTTASGMTISATTEQLAMNNIRGGCDIKKMDGTPCKAMFTRMTSRALDPNTGAAVAVQQFWWFPPSK
jgi:type IV pilus assembly protein PilX